MKAKGLACVDRAELIKWCDALDALGDDDVDKGLQMARECQHPDARWLASLFPPTAHVAPAHVAVVMLQQGDDPRALYVAWKTDFERSDAMLLRAAEMGYAPAQAEWAERVTGEVQGLFWLRKAAAHAQGNRRGLFLLGWHLYGEGANDRVEAMRLLKESSELEYSVAQYTYGQLAFGMRHWERYYWWGRSVSRGYRVKRFWNAAVDFLPEFETGQHGRVLHTMVSVIRKGLDVVARSVFGEPLDDQMGQLMRVVVLHEAMLNRAKQAIVCLSVVLWRHGVVKDVRVLIAKMVWEEAWRWGEKCSDASDEQEHDL
jgi:hypothetical protein